MDHDMYASKLSEKTVKKLFFNAEKDEGTNFVFAPIANAKVMAPDEVRKESVPINPFAAIEERNAELDQIRFDAAMRSDPTQTLIKEPAKVADKTEHVTMEQLPVVVRQAAEASILKNYRGKRF
jgi:hypothetical protein